MKNFLQFLSCLFFVTMHQKELQYLKMIAEAEKPPMEELIPVRERESRLKSYQVFKKFFELLRVELDSPIK